MNINELMANEKARYYYLATDSNTRPDILADRYQVEKLAGNTDYCLALETIIRDQARMHFHRPGVLDALAAMERAKARRKMGKGGAADLKRIARKIREKYAAGDFECLADGRVKFAIACAGTFMYVTCKDKPGAVELVACKYERGLATRNWRR